MAKINIIFYGDVVGRIGRDALKIVIPKMKKQYKADFIIVNAENAAHGSGLTKKTMKEILDAGADILTSGNHIWKKPDIEEIIKDKKSLILRPENYPKGVSGKGYMSIKKGKKELIVANFIGRVFFREDFDCPFRGFDAMYTKLKRKYKKNIPPIFIDFHAEATSEKVAFGRYCEGRAQAVIGTHTHIPTADEQILPNGTAYVSDTGMCGAKDSILGVNKEAVFQLYLTQKPSGFSWQETGLTIVNAVLITIDTIKNKATHIKRVDTEVVIK